MHITSLPQQMGGLVVKELISIFGGFKNQFPHMTWVVANVGMLTKYSLPT
jgi:hypothetical protein